MKAQIIQTFNTFSERNFLTWRNWGGERAGVKKGFLLVEKSSKLLIKGR